MGEQGIDFEIIWKKINAELTEEEELTLSEWLKEEEHRRYFEKIRDQQGKTNLVEDIKAPLLEVLQKEKEYSKAKKVMFPVGAIVLMVVAVLYFWSADQQDVNSLKADTLQPINPGTDKAILITSTGESIELNSATNLSVKDKNVSVKADGKSIVYGRNEAVHDVSAINTLMIPKGGKFSLELSDGTKVWINSDTRLEYPVAFSAEERVVSLSGEAYFEVTHDASKPFVVISNEQRLKVLGTSFNITSYEETSEVLTTLVEGSVSVQVGDELASKVLVPGMQSSFDVKSGRISTQMVDVDLFVSWKDGWFVFDNQSLEDILGTLARWYNAELFFVNSEAKEMKFTGEIERHEKIENIISLIEKTNAVKIEIKDRTIIVR